MSRGPHTNSRPRGHSQALPRSRPTPPIQGEGGWNGWPAHGPAAAFFASSTDFVTTCGDNSIKAALLKASAREGGRGEARRAPGQSSGCTASLGAAGCQGEPGGRFCHPAPRKALPGRVHRGLGWVSRTLAPACARAPPCQGHSPPPAPGWGPPPGLPPPPALTSTGARAARGWASGWGLPHRTAGGGHPEACLPQQGRGLHRSPTRLRQTRGRCRIGVWSPGRAPPVARAPPSGLHGGVGEQRQPRPLAER